MALTDSEKYAVRFIGAHSNSVTFNAWMLQSDDNARQAIADRIPDAIKRKEEQVKEMKQILNELSILGRAVRGE
jgi:predicted KAP-like P-loop ATPase